MGKDWAPGIGGNYPGQAYSGTGAPKTIGFVSGLGASPPASDLWVLNMA